MVKLFWLDKGLTLKCTLKLKDGKEAGCRHSLIGWVTTILNSWWVGEVNELGELHSGIN